MRLAMVDPLNELAIIMVSDKLRLVRLIEAAN